MTSLSRILEFGEEKMAMKKAMAKENKNQNAPEEACFLVHEGPMICGMDDLSNFMDNITKEQFEYHTKRDGNDFAQWIGDVFGEKELAKKISRVRTPKGVKGAIKKFLK